MYNQDEPRLNFNTCVKEQFTYLVEEINKKYDQLRQLTNDELRSTAYDLKAYIESIECIEEVKIALNEKLPRAYALIKEVARRFSVGNIEVSANDYDRKIADIVDFVIIRGEKAIYKNKWSVGKLSFQWNMLHYDEQLLGGILLHYGYAVEMATGEGKTLVATLPVFLNALSHNGVHLMTANDYLSKRDYEITRPLYVFLGLTVDCIEFYKKNDDKRRFAYQADITFGTNSSFIFDYLFDHLATDSKECVQSKHNYAIIDELDSILIDDANDPYIVGGGQEYDNSQIFKDNIEYIRELSSTVNLTPLYTKDNLHHTASFTQAGVEWLRKRINDDNLFKYTKISQIENWKSLSDEEKEIINSRYNLQNALYQLLLALTVYEKDIDYVVTEENSPTIAIIDPNTGRLRKSSRWEHGLHTAIEVKEGVKTVPDYDGMGVISTKNYLRLYSKIAGMSGTILAAADELKELYELKSASLPTHKPNIRIDQPLRIFKTEKDKDTAIIETVKHVQKSGRPILVGCLTIKRAEFLTNLFRNNGIKCNLLDANNEKDESLIISKAGISNTVTVATSIAGRGTDIKPDAKALENGGLMIIGTDLFSSVRVDQQLKGRTGRQGNPGSSIFFVSLEDSILRYLSEHDKRILDNLTKETSEQEIISHDLSHYFKLAQKNRENYLREKRRKTARKDDIIASRRKTFYENRNALLHDPKAADKVIDSIIDTYDLSRDYISKKLHDIYDSLSKIISGNKIVHPDIKKLQVPFSCQSLPFALTFSIRDSKTDFESVMNDYKRQLILLNYDKQWKEFVQYVLGNLDQEEIEDLDKKFYNMLTKVNQSLVNYINNTRIIFNPKQTDVPSKPLETPYLRVKSKIEVSPDSPCPCGSGKKYSECHGRNTRKKANRRR
ncbi:MAG: hypothetical protein HDR87_03730 [Bacteroides sp.]|nr:hypothetical protein [Bacteroides sp.]